MSLDLAILGTSHQKQSRTAELAALAALETYYATEGSFSSKTLEARLRAEQITSFEFNQLRWQQGTGPSNQLADLTTGSGSDVIGTIEAGRYFFVEPTGGCGSITSVANCPCDGSQQFSECFRPHQTGDQLGNNGLPEVSAFRVRLHTKTADPIKTTFTAGGGGQSSFSLSSEAIATITPRNAVFLVDLSSSVAAESHKRANYYWEFSSNWEELSQAAFRLNGSCSPTRLNVGDCTIPDGPLDPSLLFSQITWEGDSTETLDWDGMFDCRDETAVESDFQRHFKSDYECHSVDFSIDGTPKNEKYYIDVVRDIPRVVYGMDTPEYYGAEPLTTILDGIHTALTLIETYSIPGDSVSFIGFDDYIIDKRTFSNINPGDSDFELLKTITDIDDPDAIDVRIQNMFFPREPSSTDLPEAILKAQELLSTQSTSSISDSMIVLFSDGISNCSHFNGPSNSSDTRVNKIEQKIKNREFLQVTSAGPPAVYNFIDANKQCGGEIINSDTIIPAPSQFSNLEAMGEYAQLVSIAKSRAELLTLVKGSPLKLPNDFVPLKDTGIKLHTFLFGSYVQPHHLLVKGENGCLDEATARAESITFTQSSSLNSTAIAPKSSSPYRRPNRDFQRELSARTQGNYYPIRKACEPSYFNANGVPTFDSIAACNDGAALEHFERTCQLANTTVNQKIKENQDSGVEKAVTWGRVTCDPYCRTKSQQVQDAIKRLFEDNPMILVEAPL